MTASITADPSNGFSRNPIAGGAHGDIYICASGGTIVKRLRTSNRQIAAQLVCQEFELQSAMFKLFQEIDGIHVPKPLSVDPERGTIEMEYCPGTPLLSLLRMRARSTRESIESAAVRMTAVARILATAPELGKRYDFAPHNALFDPDRSVLTLVDFGVYPALQQLRSDPALQVQLISTFLASGLYECVRPSHVRRLGFASQMRILGSKVASDSQLIHPGLTPAIRSTAWEIFRAKAWKGSFQRQAWYRTGGSAAFGAHLERILMTMSPAHPELGRPVGDD
ncbi:hypothetical protein BH23CHL1_BH23CHL1_25470 [soil metagenome]